MGGALFIRQHGGVRTTDLGAIVVERSHRVIDGVGALLDDVRQLTSDRAPLRVGCIRQTVYGSMLRHLLEAAWTRDVVPRINVSSVVLMREMAAGAIDVAIIGLHPDSHDGPPPGWRQLWVVEREPFLVMLSHRHRCAARRVLDLSDLRDDAWLLPPGESDGTDTSVHAAFAAAGFTPRAPWGPQDIEEFSPYVAAGQAVCFALPIELAPDGHGITARPVRGDPVTGAWAVCWNPEAVADAEAELMARAAHAGYRDLLIPARRLSWWESHPEHRPVLNPRFAAMPDAAGRSTPS